MTRLPIISEDQLDDQQRKLWEAIVSTRGDPVQSESMGLKGPFNSMLFNPTLGFRVLGLGGVVRFETSLSQNLVEVAIITVGAHWRSSFEFWAHATMALDAGVDQAIIDDIRDGIDPVFADADEGAVHNFTRTLLTNGRVDDETYEAVAQLVGDTGAVELTTLVGYYCLISLTLNVFAVELPDGLEPIWPL